MIAGWLLPALPAQAQSLPELHYVASRFPPYSMVDSNNLATGPTASLIAALSNRIGQPGTLSVQPLARALSSAEHDSNTLIALIARNPDRERKFQWVCPVLDYDVAIFRRHDRPDVVASKVADLKQWRIGGVNRDVKTEFLQRLGLQIQMAADEDDVTRMLLHRRVDVMPAHPASVRMRMQEMGEARDTLVPVLTIPELNSRLFLAFSLNTAQSTVTMFGEACRAMIASGEVAQLMQPVLQN